MSIILSLFFGNTAPTVAFFDLHCALIIQRTAPGNVPLPSFLRVLHRTEYNYRQRVVLNQHRLMLRPRDAHDLWVDDAFLRIQPNANLRWHFDTFGNSIADATFTQEADQLVIESELLLRRYPRDLRFGASNVCACPYPFDYGDDDLQDLDPYLGLENKGEADVLGEWLDRVFTERPGDAVGFLNSLSSALHGAIGYLSREEMGTQTAAETIQRGLGTCRDFAFLFMEASRRFGFAARFVTGYLNSSSTGSGMPVGGGATHAWADVFVPGEGWIEFDPTNRITAGSALIRVATTRKPAQASPVSGSFRGLPSDFLGLNVSVTVTEMDSKP
ncbi:transglutaminase family protein [Algicella marina]|uniref:Transglutaminase family protein n=1 Tax=Algicella marina TaxID=2683284 RepID=A0A6P1T8C6_9RHOB|nr:transglutaminase family protein [Algicella marina]QHQ36852.1 transglutaminase family protein [Algicella marina]